MDSVQFRLFFYLIQQGLWEKLEKSQSSFEYQKVSENTWESIVTIADYHAVSGILFDGCNKLGKGISVPKRVLFQLFSTHMAIENRNNQLNETLKECIGILKEKNINYSLLKGQGLAYLYDNPNSRQSGDIDIYVGDKQDEALKAFIHLTNDSYINNDGKAIGFVFKDVLIELHKNVDVMPNRFQNPHFWTWSNNQLLLHPKQIKILNTELNAPPPTYNAFYVFYHLLRHFMSSGIGLRHFCDLARVLYIQYNHIDQIVLKQKLHEYGLTKEWDAVVGILIKYLGLPKDKSIICSEINWKTCEKMLVMVLREGNFGHQGPMIGRPSDKWSGKWFYLKERTKRSFLLMKIFPQVTFVSYMNYLLFGGLKIFHKQKSYYD